MDDEKNVILRIVQDEDKTQDDELTLDFGLIGKCLKRFFALWLCLALALGALSGALTLFAQRVALSGEAKALVESDGYDISKIKSPIVIEDALHETESDATSIEGIRNALEIQGVISDSAYERLSMYYSLFSQAPGAATSDLVQTLLDTDYQVSKYIVSFDYGKADMTREDGLDFLNALLRAYQDYCVSLNSNTTLQNPLSAADYREYDYAEAANIFSNTLNNISSYLSQVSGGYMASAYRSKETGFTFAELSKMASSLKEIDLDRITSYIVIHSVSSNPPARQISYYEWLIESLSQRRAVQRTRMNSLIDSINAYEKDSLVILAGQDGSSVAPGMENLNANYDAMIQEELEAQNLISSYNRSISYYEYVIEGFRQAGDNESAPDDIASVEEYLADLYEKVSELARNVSLTANEYYEQVAFSNQVRILIPAIFQISSVSLVKIVGVVEALLFLIYASASVILGIRDASPRKRESSEVPEAKPTPVPLAD